jgi:hypothetical protein
VGFVLGSADNLTLSGAGAVAITGNANANTLVANAGNCTFTGLAGADVFRFNASDAGVISGLSFDTITDYSGSSGDRLDLEGSPLIASNSTVGKAENSSGFLISSAVIRMRTDSVIEIASKKSSRNGGMGMMSIITSAITPRPSAYSPRANSLVKAFRSKGSLPRVAA